MKNIYFLLALAGFIHLVSCSTTEKTAQDESSSGMKQKHFSEEQIDADALAMADITCQWEVAKYKAGMEENNTKLEKNEKSLYQLKSAFEQKMKIRYLQIEDLEKKYTKALEKASKQLSSCEQMEVIRKMQKELEKKKTEGANQ